MKTKTFSNSWKWVKVADHEWCCWYLVTMPMSSLLLTRCKNIVVQQALEVVTIRSNYGKYKHFKNHNVRGWWWCCLFVVDSFNLSKKETQKFSLIWVNREPKKKCNMFLVSSDFTEIVEKSSWLNLQNWMSFYCVPVHRVLNIYIKIILYKYRLKRLHAILVLNRYTIKNKKERNGVWEIT